MQRYMSFIVYGAGFLIVFLPFIGFVIGGWPGAPNDCLYNDAGVVQPMGCFCEFVREQDVLDGRWGVRQPANTWSNLYAIFTAAGVALVMMFDRGNLTPGARPQNLMLSNSFIAAFYVFAVMFLGLGSMWYHASITQWGGRFDGASMYFFAGYMLWYTVFRNWPVKWLFWLGYLVTVVGFTAMHNWAPSWLLILILVVAYAAFEIVLLARGKAKFTSVGWAALWWALAVLCFGIAFIFWFGGQQGNFMCKTMSDAKSAFQPHALWHLFAGFMAIFLFYYWRREVSPHDLR